LIQKLNITEIFIKTVHKSPLGAFLKDMADHTKNTGILEELVNAETGEQNPWPPAPLTLNRIPCI